MLGHKKLGSTLIVAGTSIGAGMLALPVSTGIYGYFPALFLFILVWGYMAYTGLLVLEVNMWLEEDTNLISMAHKTLGKWGEGIAWVVYLLLLYSVLSAYTSGLGSLTSDIVESMGFNISEWIGAIGFVLMTAWVIYRGAQSVDIINRILMIGMGLAFIYLTFSLGPRVDVSLFQSHEPTMIWFALPVLSTAFGYHIVIPSLRTYVHGDVSTLRWAILVGSTVPLFVYILWETLIVGTVSVGGAGGLQDILISGQPEVGLAHALTKLLGSNWISSGFRALAFFVITTSFLGVSLSLFDFLADGLKIHKNKFGKEMLLLLTFVPPLFFTAVYPAGFVMALKYAGVFIAILLALIPALMIWSGRYVKNIAKGYRAPGGKISLLVVIAFSLVIVAIQVIDNLT